MLSTKSCSEITSFTPRAVSFFETNSDDLNGNFIRITASYYKDHFSRSKEAIVHAMKGLKNTALILGSGGMNDIPVLEFAEQFNCVVLVDINVKYTKLALQRISNDLRDKFTLKEVDLTGIFGEFSAAAEKVAQEKLPYDQFVSKILDLLPTLKRKELDLQNLRPSFIVSSLLCSQLGSQMANFLEGLSKEFYSRSFDPSERKAEIDSWYKQIDIDHINDLHRLMDEQGKIYFADHFSLRGVCYLESKVENRKHVIGEGVAQGALAIKTHLKERFNAVDKKKWTWSLPINVSIGQCEVTEEDGSQEVVPVKVTEVRECEITALTLTRKHI